MNDAPPIRHLPGPTEPSSNLPIVAPLGAVLLLPLAIIAGFDSLSAFSIVVNYLLAAWVWRRMRPAFICGFFVFAMFLTATAVGGFLLSKNITSSSGTAISLLKLSPEEHQATAVLLLTASSALLVGGSVATTILGSRGLKPSGIRESASKMLTRLSAVVIGVAAANLVLAVALNGFDAYINRSDYHLGISGGLSGLPDLIALASVVVLGALLVSSDNKSQRAMAVLLILAYWAYFFSLATRAFALTPLLVTLGVACVTRAKWMPWLIAGMATISLCLLELPLYLRGLPRHGIGPYLESLGDFAPFQNNPLTTASNFLGGFHIVGATAFSMPSIPMDMFWISVTPQSGSGAGWYEVSNSLRLGPALPYGAVGEVGNQGFVFTIIFYALLGAVLGALHWLTSIIVDRYKNPLAAIAIVGLQFNMAILATQYNLRSGMRTLYYAIAIAIAVTLLGAIAESRKARGPSHGVGKRKQRRGQGDDKIYAT